MKEREPLDRPQDQALDQEALELAALYALSALSRSEMDEVERDYRDRREFWDEVRSLRDAAGGLAESGPRARPRQDLWPEIRARVRGNAGPAAPAQVWKQWRAGDTAAPEWLLRSGEGAFEPTDIEGIAVRRLYVDEEADRVTMLVRMEAGTAYPGHRHGGAEECYVLSGDLRIGSTTEMRAGDYQRMDAGSIHEVQSTRAGCLLLITSSRHDELLG